MVAVTVNFKSHGPVTTPVIPLGNLYSLSAKENQAASGLLLLLFWFNFELTAIVQFQKLERDF